MPRDMTPIARRMGQINTSAERDRRLTRYALWLAAALIVVAMAMLSQVRP